MLGHLNQRSKSNQKHWGKEAPAVRGVGHAGEEPLPGLGQVVANNFSREELRVRDIFMAHLSAEGQYHSSGQRLKSSS
ncbi:hypothetical protein UPYG_G00228590 [Umbra pygmaea]|uniref:Uncharacterized protein n=1 Tax=Umbra pygmaea TaxID=75934 RepID=A0ABD0WVA4_UMBPY